MKYFITFFMSMALLSCTSFENIQREWTSENCNVDSAFSIGAGDAHNKINHNPKPFSACDQQIVGKLKRAYSEGYNEAIASNQLPPTLNK